MGESDNRGDDTCLATIPRLARKREHPEWCGLVARRSTRGDSVREHPPVRDLRLLPFVRSLDSPVGVAPGGRVAISGPCPRLPANRTGRPARPNGCPPGTARIVLARFPGSPNGWSPSRTAARPSQRSLEGCPSPSPLADPDGEPSRPAVRCRLRLRLPGPGAVSHVGRRLPGFLVRAARRPVVGCPRPGCGGPMSPRDLSRRGRTDALCETFVSTTTRVSGSLRSPSRRRRVCLGSETLTHASPQVKGYFSTHRVIHQLSLFVHRTHALSTDDPHIDHRFVHRKGPLRRAGVGARARPAVDYWSMSNASTPTTIASIIIIS